MKRYLCTILVAVLAAVLISGCQNADGTGRTDAGRAGESREQTGSTVDKDYVVAWTDPIVEQLVRRYLGRNDGDISRSELDGITRFGVEKREANALTGITEAYKLFINNTEEIANIDSIRMEDVQHFQNMTELKIAHVPLDDLSFLSGLTSLEKLNIISCGVADIAPLSGLTNLEILSLDQNSITDLSPMAGMTSLTFVRLYANSFHDISALSSLEKLKSLYLGENDIDDYSPLYGLINLDYLVLGDNVSEEQRTELREYLPFCTVNG